MVPASLWIEVGVCTLGRRCDPKIICCAPIISCGERRDLSGDAPAAELCWGRAWSCLVPAEPKFMLSL